MRALRTVKKNIAAGIDKAKSGHYNKSNIKGDGIFRACV